MHLYHTTSFDAAAEIDAKGFGDDAPFEVYGPLSGGDREALFEMAMPMVEFLQDRPLKQADLEDLIENSDPGDDGVRPEDFVSLKGCDVVHRITVPAGLDLTQYEVDPGAVPAGETSPGIYREWCVPTVVLNTWSRERI